MALTPRRGRERPIINPETITAWQERWEREFAPRWRWGSTGYVPRKRVQVIPIYTAVKSGFTAPDNAEQIHEQLDWLVSNG